MNNGQLIMKNEELPELVKKQTAAPVAPIRVNRISLVETGDKRLVVDVLTDDEGAWAMVGGVQFKARHWFLALAGAWLNYRKSQLKEFVTGK